MPRNLHPGVSTLRNRNRITNKTRLKIHHGNLDADALLIPDEDEEKHRLTNLVAGVDAEDANEHHLQEVLSASQRSHAGIHRSGRGAAEQATASAPPAAYIPTPDSTGVVDDYDELYPANRWKDPVTYVCTSTTVEEAITGALANGFTYYLDERDKEWLDKNNEEARGEGTSAQGAISASGTRTSARSAKSKGKEPEVSQPVVISEDEFELVMGLFEKVTHEKTEYLHHGLENGMAFPPFSDYQETFSSPLPQSTFASFIAPSWIPQAPGLLRIARTIYPYWKERRIERGGHRILPVLNGDETDTLNESYICFRRREIKAVRKTRASQVTSSDKLTRLQTELSYPLELAKLLLNREALKKESTLQSKEVWERRLALVDLKRKFPSLGDKGDEELLIDKEKPVKRPESRIPLKIRTQDSVSRSEISMRPKERFAMINEQIDNALAQRKEMDHHWEDQVDNPYQPSYAPYSSRLFTWITPPVQSTLSDSDEDMAKSSTRDFRSVRLRRGRGGRILIDRRHHVPRKISLNKHRSSLFGPSYGIDVDSDVEDLDRSRRLEERWRFDLDDIPPIGPRGPDEHDRLLVDDYDSKYLRHSMTLLSDTDQQQLYTDGTLHLTGPEGRPLAALLPYRLGMQQPAMRRDASGVPRPYHFAMMQQAAQAGHPLAIAHANVNGTPVSMQQPMKKMPPPGSVPQTRISSNGGMRPPGIPLIPSISATNAVSHSSPPHHSVPAPQHSSPTGANGTSRAAINMPHVDGMMPESNLAQSIINGVVPNPQQDVIMEGTVNGVPSRPKSQNQQPQSFVANGFHVGSMSQAAALALANTNQYNNLNHLHPTSGLSTQQVQNLKSAFANMGDAPTMQANAARGMPGAYMHVIPNGLNMNMQMSQVTPMNLKLPPNRQWPANNSQLQMQNPALNGVDSQGMNGTVSSSPNLSHTIPIHSPIVNGARVALRNGNGHMIGTNGHMSISPHMQHTSPPIPSISQSPPRLPVTPTMTLASPSLQHQQSVGSTQGGY